MNLNTITAVKRPKSADEIRHWRAGDAWLAGGTWLFSTPQIATDTLIDLASLKWPALVQTATDLEIAATCQIADLYAFVPPADWNAGSLIHECCRSFLSSFKIWNEATVGGNLCMSLPAGPMISLTVALEAVCTIWPRDGAPIALPAIDFVTGNHTNVLAPGDLLRSIAIPLGALAKTYAFRRSSLTHLGRSAVLIIGTRGTNGEFRLTVTAATDRPYQLTFATAPAGSDLRDAIESAIPASAWFDDVHGSPPHRKHLTSFYAEEIRAELFG